MRTATRCDKKKYKIRISPADIILIVILIALSFTGFIFQNKNTQTGRFYTIEMEGKTLYRLSLTSDRLITIDAKTGEVKVCSQNGRVCISESSCPLKICVKTGWINKPGEAIICVPNRIVIRIEGEKRGKSDAITQ